ncbi:MULTISPECIES: phosphotransferase [unclassified Prevotella]|uniref:phosphotransferase n=1 Tax=unclassified Prevotella TaxID=2638335 RepID=UPI001140D0AD|nr:MULTISPECIES: phosphotransferase [unclassified Prevotella]
MKKVDLHIHTISTVKDYPFNFEMDSLVKYVQSQKIDVIAITNHNVFDRKQYEQICSHLPSTLVLPGIEIDIDGGHALFLSDKEPQALYAFEAICKQIAPLVNSQDDTIPFEQIETIFKDFSDYLVIPHYDKEPKLPSDTIVKFGANIFAGEVCSVKKFVTALKNRNSLVPVLFSDFRVETLPYGAVYPNRQTYIDINDVTVNNLKLCLRDKAKVGLAPTDGHDLFQWSSSGLCLSTGLNIILGKRSSGKTYTLNRIDKHFGGKALYIRQFSLLNTKDPNSIEQFEQEDKIKQERIASEYLKPFKEIIEDICQVPTMDSDMYMLEQYMKSLVKYANEQHLNDVYSKTQMFNTPTFQSFELDELKNLIDSTERLITSKTYEKIIEDCLDKNALKILFCRLVEKYRQLYLDNLLIDDVNVALVDIKRNLQMKSSATRIPDIDLYAVLRNNRKRQRFNEVAHNLQKQRIINQRSVSHFTVSTSTRPYFNATDMKQGMQVSLVEVFNSYSNPYAFLQKLKGTAIESTDYYKYFVKVEYKILNSLGAEVSGGERTEFNFLSKVKDAMTHDILIIDEPESSFDNIFLKEEVNTLIKEMSQTMPVIVSTHNSTIGGSIKPDYILYTEKSVVDGYVVYKVYEGRPDSKLLKTPSGDSINNYIITMNSLEAGEAAYNNRKQGYDLLKN